jgi:hypothetical protein
MKFLQDKLVSDPNVFDKESVLGELNGVWWNHFEIEKIDIVRTSFCKPVYFIIFTPF